MSNRTRRRVIRYSVSAFLDQNSDERNLAGKIAYQVALGDTNAVGILADKMEEQGHPAADIVRRIFHGQAEEIPYHWNSDRINEYDATRIFDDEHSTYPFPPEMHLVLPEWDTYGKKFVHPQSASVVLSYLNHPTGHFFKMDFRGSGSNPARSFLIPTTAEEAESYGNAVSANSGVYEYLARRGNNIARASRLQPGEHEPVNPHLTSALSSGPEQMSRRGLLQRYAKGDEVVRGEIKGHNYVFTKNQYGWGVSGGMGKSYQVYCDESGNPTRCSCPDNVYRGGVCKHMKAVQGITDTATSADPDQEQVGKMSRSRRRIIYAANPVKGGVGDKTPKRKLPRRALAIGKGVEMEHTSSPAVAEDIARDHLTERPDYYRVLAEAEEKPVKNDAYRAPAGGIIARGTHYKGGETIPDMEGDFMNPPASRPIKKQEDGDDGDGSESGDYPPAGFGASPAPKVVHTPPHTDVGIKRRINANTVKRMKAALSKSEEKSEREKPLIVSYRRGAVRRYSMDHDALVQSARQSVAQGEGTPLGLLADYLQENNMPGAALARAGMERAQKGGVINAPYPNMIGLDNHLPVSTVKESNFRSSIDIYPRTTREGRAHLYVVHWPSSGDHGVGYYIPVRSRAHLAELTADLPHSTRQELALRMDPHLHDTQDYSTGFGGGGGDDEPPDDDPNLDYIPTGDPEDDQQSAIAARKRRDEKKKLSRRGAVRRYMTTGTPEEHQGFHEAIRANPRDMTARGAYADYLQEHHPNTNPQLLKVLRNHKGDVWVHHGPEGIIGGPRMTWAMIRKENENYNAPDFEARRESDHEYGQLSDPNYRASGRPYSGPGGHYFVMNQTFHGPFGAGDEHSEWNVYRFHPDTRGISAHTHVGYDGLDEGGEQIAHQLARELAATPTPPAQSVQQTSPEPDDPSPPSSPSPPAGRQPPKPITLNDLLKPRRKSRRGLLRRYELSEEELMKRKVQRATSRKKVMANKARLQWLNSQPPEKLAHVIIKRLQSRDGLNRRHIIWATGLTADNLNAAVAHAVKKKWIATRNEYGAHPDATVHYLTDIGRSMTPTPLSSKPPKLSETELRKRAAERLRQWREQQSMKSLYKPIEKPERTSGE